MATYAAARGAAFSADERAALLAEWTRLNDESEQIRVDDGDLGDRPRRLIELVERYIEAVPIVPIGRCPLTGTEIRHSVDVYGLDGLWWDCEALARPAEPTPPTWFGTNGAIRLGGPVPDTPFLVKPGPEVPFVLPRLLNDPRVRAVMASVPVGEHTAIAISYVAQPWPDDLDPMNAWANNSYRAIGSHGQPTYGRAYDEDTHDYEIEPWIEQGKLSWIAPGDPGLTLRGDVDACPYLGLDGLRDVLRLKWGEIHN